MVCGGARGLLLLMLISNFPPAITQPLVRERYITWPLSRKIYITEPLVRKRCNT